MKKVFAFLILLLFPFMVNAFVIEGFEKTIKVSLDCNECKDKNERQIRIKVYADGQPLEETERVLKIDNDFTATYQDVPIFKDDGFTEINYEVRFYEDGEFKPFGKSEISYDKANVSKWISVFPEDIKPGDRYVIVTDNWNHEANGGPELVITSGDMRVYGTTIVADYKIINGKTSYYSLDDTIEENDKWNVSKVSSNELLYEGFENYLVFTNSEGKRMTLSGFDKDTYIDYVFRQTSKPDGYNEGEKSWNTTKVEIIPIEEELGRFYISSHNIINDEVRGTRYIGIDHFQNVVAQKEQEYGAHFIAFKYVEDTEEQQVYNVRINRTICRNSEDTRKVLLSDSVDVLGVFDDIGDITGVVFNVVDPSIAKIVNGKVIPLKIGETDVNFKYGFTDYTLHVVVYDVPGHNPKTSVGNIIALMSILFVSATLIISIGKSKKA